MSLSHYMKVLGCEKSTVIKKYSNMPSLLRLKGITYLCGMDYASKDIYNFSEKITRYDHSFTTSALIKYLGGTYKEEVAALFHDVATPCFSHAIDYMNKDYANQESTEDHTDDIVLSDSTLLDTLKSDGILPEEVYDFKRYHLVDLPRPKLCADRLDGIILTAMAWTNDINDYLIDSILNDIRIYGNEEGQKEIGFKSTYIAEIVMNMSDKIDRYCHSNEDNYMMSLLASMTKYAIEQEIISYDDLFIHDESTILSKFELSSDELLHEMLNEFKTITKKEIPYTNMPDIKRRVLKPLVGGMRLQ